MLGLLFKCSSSLSAGDCASLSTGSSSSICWNFHDWATEREVPFLSAKSFATRKGFMFIFSCWKTISSSSRSTTDFLIVKQSGSSWGWFVQREQPCWTTGREGTSTKTLGQNKWWNQKDTFGWAFRMRNFGAMLVFAFLFLHWHDWLHTRQRGNNPLLFGFWTTLPVIKEKPASLHGLKSIQRILLRHSLEFEERSGGNQWQPQTIWSRDCHLLGGCLCSIVETMSKTLGWIADNVGNNATVIGGVFHCRSSNSMEDGWKHLRLHDDNGHLFCESQMMWSANFTNNVISENHNCAIRESQDQQFSQTVWLVCFVNCTFHQSCDQWTSWTVWFVRWQHTKTNEVEIHRQGFPNFASWAKNCGTEVRASLSSRHCLDWHAIGHKWCDPRRIFANHLISDPQVHQGEGPFSRNATIFIHRVMEKNVDLAVGELYSKTRLDWKERQLSWKSRGIMRRRRPKNRIKRRSDQEPPSDAAAAPHKDNDDDSQVTPPRKQQRLTRRRKKDMTWGNFEKSRQIPTIGKSLKRTTLNTKTSWPFVVLPVLALLT